MTVFDSVLSCGYELQKKTQGRTISSDFEKVLAIFLGGTTKTLQAIKLLYDNGFYEEAFSLTRILLEAVVDLLYINLNKTKNAEGYIEFDKLKANEHIDMLSNVNSPLASQPKFSIKIKFKDKTRWSQLTFGGMLKKIFPNDKRTIDSHLLFYKYLCGFSHPSTSGLGATTVFAKENIPAIEKNRDDSRRSLPLLSCQLVLAIYFTIDAGFSLGNSTQIQQIQDEISRLVQPVQN